MGVFFCSRCLNNMCGFWILQLLNPLPRCHRHAGAWMEEHAIWMKVVFQNASKCVVRLVRLCWFSLTKQLNSLKYIGNASEAIIHLQWRVCNNHRKILTCIKISANKQCKCISLGKKPKQIKKPERQTSDDSSRRQYPNIITMAK